MSNNVKKIFILLTAIVVLIIVAVLVKGEVEWSFFDMNLPLTLGLIFAIAFGGFLVFWKMLQEKKKGIPLKDERMIYINGLAALYTFGASLYFISGLLLYNIFIVGVMGWHELDMTMTLVMIFVVMVLIFFGLRWIIGKRGDGSER